MRPLLSVFSNKDESPSSLFLNRPKLLRLFQPQDPKGNYRQPKLAIHMAQFSGEFGTHFELSTKETVLIEK